MNSFHPSIKNISYSIAAIGLTFFLSSCAMAPVKIPPSATALPGQASFPGARQDIIHIVAPGETLFRISKMYDVSIKDIMLRNNLISPKDLKMGERIVIPQAAALKPVIPLFKTNKWKYIIIHHSATDEGNALSLYYLHSRRGFEGLGYHFVIDNGTKGKGGGQIEASPRWIHQKDGAHCKAWGMNRAGIGICLVGNFSQERVSEEQLDSLVYLVNILKVYYNIPSKNIMGHGQVPGARTECPGKYFPWQEFRRRLSALN